MLSCTIKFLLLEGLEWEYARSSWQAFGKNIEPTPLLISEFAICYMYGDLIIVLKIIRLSKSFFFFFSFKVLLMLNMEYIYIYIFRDKEGLNCKLRQNQQGYDFRPHLAAGSTKHYQHVN